MNKTLRLIFGLGFFALLLSYTAGSFYIWLFPPGSDAGWYVSDYVSDGFSEFQVSQIAPQGPAQELRPGDKIIAINGVNAAEHAGVLNDEYRLAPGSPYSMTVERNSQEMTFAWQTIPRRRGSFPWDKLVPLLFWLSGLIVLSLKAEDRQAWLLALMLGSFSTVLNTYWQEEITTNWLALPVALAHIGGLFSAPLLFHLFLYFPQPSPWLRRWPKLTRWLYAPLCLFVLPTFGVSRLPLKWAASIVSWPPARWLWEHGLRLADLTLLGYLLAALVCLWLSYRTADTAGRRRLRVVMWGSLIGFSSLFLVLVMEATNTRGKWNTIGNWLWFSMRFTLPLVPLSFAYAIVRHRVIPISLILRRGVRYLLVSRGSVVLTMAGLSVLLFFFLDNFFRFLRPTSGRVIGVISAIVGIVFWRLTHTFHQRIIAPAIDRHFFRQAYDAQQILSELVESLRMTTDIPTLLAAVANKLQAALQTESVLIFLRDEATGDYQSAYGCTYSTADGRAVAYSGTNRLPHYAATVARLAQTGAPLELDGGEPAFALAATNGHSQLTKEERETLLEIKSTLLLPLKIKDALSGVVALGSRLGDLPFSGEDKRLLQSVGASASLALENAQLVERMITEARRRQEIEAENEQRAKELEEARQLQLSMLPRRVPQLPHFEIAAYMKTATEVGGDYYDFHVGADGVLTIAIGDATGHGLKAGTVVTATKGLFNHLAGQTDLTATLAQTSRALKQMNLRSLFMALTLVKLNGAQLQCSVAGMPPILIYRAATHAVEEIPLHGAPLGGLAHYVYRQAETALAAGDVVLLLSDGLPERFDAAGEMFGYEQVKETLLANAQSAPQSIIESLLQTSDEWAGGKAADDDMTFVALRHLGS